MFLRRRKHWGKKQRQLAIRVSEEEHIALQTIAYKTRKPMAEIIREIIARIAAGEIAVEPLPPPVVKVSGSQKTESGQNETADITTAFDVAAYILSRLGPLPTAKLHKLVYYCQAWSLVWDKRPLFPEQIEAWSSGPIIPELYAHHRKRSVVDNVPGNPERLDKDAKDTVDAVILFYGVRTPQWLSDLVHREDPWKNARQGIPEGVQSAVPITLESMAEYYGSLMSERGG